MYPVFSGIRYFHTSHWPKTMTYKMYQLNFQVYLCKYNTIIYFYICCYRIYQPLKIIFTSSIGSMNIAFSGWQITIATNTCIKVNNYIMSLFFTIFRPPVLLQGDRITMSPCVSSILFEFKQDEGAVSDIVIRSPWRRPGGRNIVKKSDIYCYVLIIFP